MKKGRWSDARETWRVWTAGRKKQQEDEEMERDMGKVDEGRGGEMERDKWKVEGGRSEEMERDMLSLIHI